MDISLDHPNWTVLKTINGLANTNEDIARNIRSAVKRGLPSMRELMHTKSGAVAIVGSGPSLKETWTRLKDFDGDILACNAACQFLLERGITPTYMMCFDADPLMLEFITPHKDIKHLIASRCPAEAFDMLKGCDVYIWHAGGDRYIEEILQENGLFKEPMVNGGTAAVTRSMYVAPILGYTELHIFGGDSSFADNGDTHIRKSTTDEKHIYIKYADKNNPKKGRVFLTAPWMTNQIEDFKILAPDLRENYGIRIVMHGDGYMQHVAKTMFFEGDGQGKVKCWMLQWKHNARELWRYT